MDTNTHNTTEERIKYISDITANKDFSSIPKQTLEDYADYILEFETKKSKNSNILTKNRMYTINKRETSYEGLSQKFEAGEDGMQGLIRTNDKNQLLTKKIQITDRDIAVIPCLGSLRAEIRKAEQQLKAEKDPDRRKKLYKWLIDMRKDQYVLKMMFYGTSLTAHITMYVPPDSIISELPIEVEEDRIVKDPNTISFFNPDHNFAILSNYSFLKEQTEGQINKDIYYVLQDFERLADSALTPLQKKIIQLKIENKTGKEIIAECRKEFNESLTTSKISKIWRRGIPLAIAEKATDDYLYWYYTYKVQGQWKKCSCCGQVKLRFPRYFTKNKSSKDGYYTICKECRTKKRRGEAIQKDGDDEAILL